MSTFIALALLALSLWLAPRVRDWALRTFHDQEACPVCQRRQR